MAQDIPHSPPHSGDPSFERNSTGDLLRRLVHDVSALLRSETALLRTELVHAADKAKAGFIALATGAAVLLSGLLTLVAAATLALAQVVEPWIAALIVGASLAIIGLAMVSAGKRRMEPSNFALTRTQASLRADGEVIARKTS